MENSYDSIDALVIENESTKQLLLSKIPPINFNNLFFSWLGPSLKTRFIQLLSITEISPFFKALEYELGLNNTPQNLRKAYFLYLENATHTTDYLSMYRIFEIHFRESDKFKIQSDKILEMFFLFKSCAYYPSFSFETEIFQEFNPKNVLLTLLESDYLSFEKYNLFMEVIKNNIRYTHLLKDFSFIHITVMLLTDQVYGFDKVKYSVQKEEENNLEMKLKLAETVYRNNKNYAFQLLEECKDMKYYRAFLEYGRFVQFELGMIEEAIDAYKQGLEGGNFMCYNYYYYACIRNVDFSSHEKAIKELLNIIPYLINAILFKNYALISELLDIVKYIYKHNGTLPQEYETYLQEIISFLLNNKDTNTYELLYNLGLLYSYKYSNMVEQNFTTALFYFNKITEQQGLPLSILRSINGRIFNIKCKLHKQGLLTEEELMNFAKQYYELIQETLSSSEGQVQDNPSVNYCAGKLIEFIHNKENDNKKYLKDAYNYYYRNVFFSNNYRFVFGCFVRKQKSIMKLKEEKFKKREEKEEPKILSVKMSDCEICYANKLDIYFVPCSHKCCSVCYEKLKGKSCPFCRRIIERVIIF